ncbi:hypothetical protein AAG906_010410 [Vitis piasezkii]
MDRHLADYFARPSFVGKNSRPPCEANSSPFPAPQPPRRRRDLRLSPISGMVRIRGGHTDPSASREARPSASAPQDPSQLRHQLGMNHFSPLHPSIHRIPPKRVRTSGLEETSSQALIDSQVLADTQRPSGIDPEVIIKRPMVIAPSILGNSDCRARPFHSELYFNMEAMRQQSNLRDSVAMDFYQSMTTQGAQSPTTIRFSIDGHQSILEARHIRIQSSSDSGSPYLSETWSSFYREGLLEIHSCYHMGYPTEPHLECRHYCREHFTLGQWTQLAEKNPMESAPEAAPLRLVSPVPAQPDQAQQDEHPTKSIPSTPTTPSMPQAAFTDPSATPPIPPVAPPPS